MSDVVRVEVTDRVATVTLNRPDKLNAMNPEVFEGLAEAGRRLEFDDEVRAIVLRGEGRAFSSGLDLTSLGGFGAGNAASPAAFEGRIPVMQEGWRIWSRIRKPVIAAVQGYAFGAGLQLALAADLRLAAEGAVLSVFEITYGLVPDLGATQRLPKLVGPARAKELIWTARKFTAEEAERWGIVNRVVPAEQLEKEAMELARDLASRPPLPIGYVKELVEASNTVAIEEGMRREGQAQLVCIFSDDCREAVSAAFEKRPGNYKGS